MEPEPGITVVAFPLLVGVITVIVYARSIWKVKVEMSELTVKMMTFLARDEGDMSGEGPPIDVEQLVNIFDVNKIEVLYLFRHHAQMGRLIEKPIVRGTRGAVVGHRYSITMAGRQWLSKQKK